MVNRVLRDDPSKSDMHNREGLHIRKIWQVIKDWRMWPIYVLGLIHMSMSIIALFNDIPNLTIHLCSSRQPSSNLSYPFTP